MAKVTADNGEENYSIVINSTTGNLIVADEPVEKGGKNKGFSPKELLVSALAACTSATVRMYCARKEWNLKNIHIEIELIEDDGRTVFKRRLRFEGDLDDQQRDRLLVVANACPVHKILTHEIAVDTEMLH